MRKPIFEPKAPKQTVSVSLNSDLYTQAKRLGIKVSRVAEEALATEYAARLREALRAELQEDLAAVERYTEVHGSFGTHVRAHYESEPQDAEAGPLNDDGPV